MLPALTAGALADAIGRVLRDDGLRQSLRERARERGRALRWTETTRLTLDVLRDVAADSRPREGRPS
jgi:glycosyltransferase involved in cell wall biosynthesis